MRECALGCGRIRLLKIGGDFSVGTEIAVCVVAVVAESRAIY